MFHHNAGLLVMDTDMFEKPFVAKYIYVMLIKDTKAMHCAINFIACKSMWIEGGKIFICEALNSKITLFFLIVYR